MFLVECCPTKSPKTCPSNQALLAQAQDLARGYNGQCLSQQCSGVNQPLLFQCALGHQWKSNNLLKSQEWCRKCANKLRKAQIWAKSHSGELISTVLEQTVVFRCSQGHQWNDDIDRYATRRWCKACRDQVKSQVKHQAKVVAENKQKEQELLQQQLFLQARQLQSQSPAEKSKAYVGAPGAEAAYDEALSVYTILSLSQDDLVSTYFQPNFDRMQVTRRFRALARRVHPDKNKHPQAQQAFVALMQAYSQVITRIAV